jgi:NTE family protein
MRRALVLGAGGNAAIAWEIGVITGMADAGVDLRDADLMVGTSAGSIVAAQLTSGLGLEKLFQGQVDPPLHAEERPPQVDFVQWRAAIAAARQQADSDRAFLRQVGSLARSGSAESAAERRTVIAARLPRTTWPTQPVLIVAVDAENGERRAFARDSGADFIDAVSASCAVAGIWPAVPIDGTPYIDGGFYSIDNADLAVGHDRVLVLTLPARVPSICVLSLDAAVNALRREGARVEVVHPDDAGRAAFASVGGNLLDPTVREGAARAGREQGRIVGPRILSLWR